MVRNFLKQCTFLAVSIAFLPLMGEDIAKPTATKLYKKPVSSSKKIWFQFKDEPLADVINYLAQIMKINMVLPAGDDALTQKLTFQLPEKISISTAWEHALTILKVAGYSVIDQNNFYYVKKNGANINKDSLPLYIQTPPDQLPIDDQRIRFMYYFSNISVANNNSGGASGSPVTTVLQNMLSTSASFMFETGMNAVIISDYSRNIRSAMKLLERLDTHGPTESVILIPLRHVNAAMVAQLFQQLIPASSTQSQSDAFSGISGSDTSTGPSTANSQYFSQSTRIVSIPRTNSLVIMGKKEALEHIKHFIKTNIDIPLKNGAPVIHIYPLEYLDSQTLAPILQKIVTSQSGGDSSGGSMYGSSTGQSTSTGTTQGNERFFNGVIIMAEPVSQNSNGGNGSGGQSTWWTTGDNMDATFTAPPPSQRGGNRLIVAATQEDWIRIKKLIKELDTQQPQIALEVLVVDLTLNGLKVLGSQLRNLSGLNWQNINGQTSNLGTLVVTGDPSPTAANALQSNLLQPYDNSGDTLANQADGGSLIMALRDQGESGNNMWWVSQILREADYAKVLAQPFAIALNNQIASFGVQESRILAGNATVVKGANVVQLAQINAKINLAIQPRISENGNINLGLNISISQFSSADTSNGNQSNRQITTNANIKDGEVLILGGLSKDTLTSEDLTVPILGKIPVLKWFFARKQKATSKENLLVFICAKKMTPSTDAFYDIFTAGKIEHAGNVLEEHGETFDSLRDPINRWFFGAKSENVSPDNMNHFEKRKMFAPEHHYKEEFLAKHPGAEASVEKDPGITTEALTKEQKFRDALLHEYIGQAEPAPELDIPIRTITVAQQETPKESIAREEESFKEMLAKLPVPL